MLIKFFPNGKGAGAGPVGYLVAERVLAHDGNRDLIRDADGQPVTVPRDPLPEVLRGNPERTEDLIDASRHQWTYRGGVISFADTDDPTEEQQAEVMDGFERLAFVGLDPEQYEVLWVRHRHEGRVELHFCTPRLELTTGKSLNIAPPGYQDAYDSLRDVMNQRHGWADPMDVERAQEVRNTIEAPTRAQGRDELHAWIQDQIDMGLITNRATMIDALTDAGFDLPRTGKAYITARDPETGERWRLKGEISMKTGKPTRLSEKLNAELDTIRAEHVASISSQLKSFRIDLKNIVGAAQHTIASDTRRFQTETANMFETRLNSIRLWLTISPWLIAAMALTGIASMMAASFFWTVHLTRSELTELGLTRIERPEGTWLILDPSKTRLRTCAMGERHVTCIRIEED